MPRPSQYVRSFDNRLERLVDPQPPARLWLGQSLPAKTGFIAPYGKGAYRHSFSGCGCGMGGDDQGMPAMAWLLLIGGGLALGYTLLYAVGPQKRRT